MNNIWMSFDGPPDIQDHDRSVRGRYATLPIPEENISRFMKNRSDHDLMVGARVAMTDDDAADRHIEIIDYFFDLGNRTLGRILIFFCVGEVSSLSGPDRAIRLSA
jgi:sulfatase maturation enzyme AslB (radical SAM superfamily)